MIEFYTDGSATNHGKNGGFGVVIVKDNKIIGAYGEKEKDTTNNRMEMSAILWALENFKSKEESLKIYSDSEYSINVFGKWMYGWANRGWIKADGTEPKNLDLVKRFYNLIQEGYKVELEWIKGHDNILYNELADALATGNVERFLKLREE